MKTLHTLLITAAAVAFSGAAFAGDNWTPEEKVKKMDTDMDNQVSLAEFAAAGKTQDEFKKMDMDGNGYVTAAEVKAGKDRAPAAGDKKDTGGMNKPQPTTGEPTGEEK